MTRDGLWEYTWDAENRLAGMRSRSAVPTEHRRKLAFLYDADARRIRKEVYLWDDNASDYVLDHAIRFVWDGWLMVAELREDNSTLRTYTWGLDLSGSLEGAGGIGGLAAVRSDADNATYYPGYDGNGNIRALISDNGTLAAKFEYSPFGRTLAATGPAADACPFGFSTKYADAETIARRSDLR